LAQAAGALGVSALLFFLAFLALLWASKASRPRQRWAGLVFALLLGADLSWSNGPNESTALPARDFAMLEPAGGDPLIAELKARVAATAGPDRRDRIELAGLGFAWPNASLSHGLDNDLGYNPVRLALFEDFTGAGDHVALPEQRVFSKAFPSYRALAADLMGLRFIATGVPVGEIDKNLKAGDLIALGKIGAAFLYENPRAFPRVLGVRAARAADFSAILRDGAWPQGDYRQMVLVENEGVSGEVARAPQARIVAYANDRVEIALDAPDGGWIVLNDIWHPGWRARIDGTPVDVLRANVAFRAVRAPAGAKSLIFEFAPLSGLAGGLRQKLGLGR
jgi:hypothetical protein